MTRNVIPTNGAIESAPHNENYLELYNITDYYQGSEAVNTVKQGLAMTPSGTPDLDVAVGAGYYIGSDGAIKTYAGGTATFTSAHATASNISFDFITIDDDGNLTVTDGTNALIDAVSIPSLPAGETVIGYAVRYPSDNTIDANDLVDLRVIGDGSMDRLGSFEITDSIPSVASFRPMLVDMDSYKSIKIDIAISRESSGNIWSMMRINNDATASSYAQNWLYYEGGTGLTNDDTTDGEWIIYLNNSDSSGDNFGATSIDLSWITSSITTTSTSYIMREMPSGGSGYSSSHDLYFGGGGYKQLATASPMTYIGLVDTNMQWGKVSVWGLK